MKRIMLGADHRGREAVHFLADRLKIKNLSVDVVAPPEGESCDYPSNAYTVANAVASGHADMGVLICGTGVGMSIAANKIDGVRAAAVHDEITAELSRSHNNANVICMSADLLGHTIMEKIIDMCLKTEFAGGRHQRRIDCIAKIEQGESPEACSG